MGRLGLILFTGHPDRQAVVVQQQAVEGFRLGETHLFDLDAQVVEKGPEVDRRHAQSDNGENDRQQSGTLALANL